MRNMLDGIGYDCIRKDRREGIGGGVALVYDTSELSFQQLKTGTEHEIVAALGRRTGQRRKVVAMSVYIPPNLDADQSDSVMQKVSEHIGTFKRRYSSPYFIIGGDFNKRNIQRELRGYPDLKLVITPPTRGVIHSTSYLQISPTWLLKQVLRNQSAILLVLKLTISQYT